jgi:hypothetical protein
VGSERSDFESATGTPLFGFCAAVKTEAFAQIDVEPPAPACKCRKVVRVERGDYITWVLLRRFETTIGIAFEGQKTVS